MENEERKKCKQKNLRFGFSFFDVSSCVTHRDFFSFLELRKKQKQKRKSERERERQNSSSSYFSDNYDKLSESINF